MKQRHKNVPQHNYLRKLQFLWSVGALPRSVGLHQIRVDHANWCALFEGAYYNCNPNIRLQWLQTAAAQN